ncbi:MAG: twin-arginine translocation signal domain-containing protein [Salinibacter sp.]
MITRRDFLKGTAGTVGAVALASPSVALGQSDSSVMGHIRSSFQ